MLQKSKEKQNILQKLNKTELLVLMKRQEEENLKLREQIKNLENTIYNMKKQLNERKITFQNAGSLAEASIGISKVFEAAQKAADTYLENIKEKNSEMEIKVADRNRQIEEMTKAALDETNAKADAIISKAKREAELIWQQQRKTLDNYCMAHTELQRMFELEINTRNTA